MTDPTRDNLDAAIAEALWRHVSANRLAAVCEGLGLPPGTRDEAFDGKRKYVRTRLAKISDDDALAIARGVEAQFRSEPLRRAIEFAATNGVTRISLITRRNLLNELFEVGPLHGAHELLRFLGATFDLESMPPPPGYMANVEAVVQQHCVRNDDLTEAELYFDVLELSTVPDATFVRFLDSLVDPACRSGKDQAAFVQAINHHLAADGFICRHTSTVSGYPKYTVSPLHHGVPRTARNLVFAARGEKPDIVIDDFLNNDVRVVRNASNCLFYDRPFGPRGLSWQDLTSWWSDTQGTATSRNTERDLFLRLRESLDRGPEQWFFNEYYANYNSKRYSCFPALVPQVYLHYDPMTAKRLAAMGLSKRLERQRMDFLLLLPHGVRVVLEIDGQQHYSDGARSAPKLYAKMVAEDRRLKLCGYEVFRFGGSEFVDQAMAATMLRSFFEFLFEKYDYRPTPLQE